MDRCKITKKKDRKIPENYKIEFNNLTVGECMALASALVRYSKDSPVAHDLASFMRNATSEMTGDTATKALAQILKYRFNELP